uniref:aminotransferase class I/II-fold pyridoxal phosphate-dependent enzyme n=1 Tax=Staphylococcus condimenti TaxID=70255 RepID=UPI0021B45621
ELFYYPETGSPSLRKAISKHLNVDESRILFGAGLDEVILMISRAVLTPGDKIVTSDVNQFHAVKGLLSKLLNEDSEILTMIS